MGSQKVPECSRKVSRRPGIQQHHAFSETAVCYMMYVYTLYIYIYYVYNIHIYMYREREIYNVYMYIYTHIICYTHSIDIYIYMYICRERDICRKREVYRERWRQGLSACSGLRASVRRDLRHPSPDEGDLRGTSPRISE